VWLSGLFTESWASRCRSNAKQLGDTAKSDQLELVVGSFPRLLTPVNLSSANDRISTPSRSTTTPRAARSHSSRCRGTRAGKFVLSTARAAVGCTNQRSRHDTNVHPHDSCYRSSGRSLPTWPHSKKWGYYPSGAIGVAILLILFYRAVGSAMSF
jgi:Protein of unknown function (DUF3309)